MCFLSCIDSLYSFIWSLLFKHAARIGMRFDNMTASRSQSGSLLVSICSSAFSYVQLCFYSQSFFLLGSLLVKHILTSNLFFQLTNKAEGIIRFRKAASQSAVPTYTCGAQAFHRIKVLLARTRRNKGLNLLKRSTVSVRTADQS